MMLVVCSKKTTPYKTNVFASSIISTERFLQVVNWERKFWRSFDSKNGRWEASKKYKKTVPKFHHFCFLFWFFFEISDIYPFPIHFQLSKFTSPKKKSSSLWGFRTCSVAVDGETPARYIARPIVFVSARVHPGETPGGLKFVQLKKGYCKFPYDTVDGWNPKQPPGMYENL